MTKNIKFMVALLLALSAILLGVLVPGGPIETRSFSNINPFILGVFNTFLTTLGLLSLLLTYFIFKEMRWAFLVSIFCGICYLAVYVLDLGKIFPVSLDQMPRTLMIIEILGSIVSLPLILTSVQGAREPHNDKDNQMVSLNQWAALLIGLVILVGIGIIIFATNAAMH